MHYKHIPSTTLPLRSSLLSRNSPCASCCTWWQIASLQNNQTRLCEIYPGKHQCLLHAWHFVKVSTFEDLSDPFIIFLWSLPKCSIQKFTKNEIFQQFIYTFLNNLCSASNKIKSRYDHSDLIHVPLYQSKSCFCRTYQTNFWDNFGIFFMSFRWKLIRLAIFQNIKGLGKESKLLIDFGTLNNILMHRRSVKLNMVKQ